MATKQNNISKILMVLESDRIEEKRVLDEKIAGILSENKELFKEDVASIAAAIGAGTSAINRFAPHAKSDAEIIQMLLQSIDKFPQKGKDAIKLLAKKYARDIENLELAAASKKLKGHGRDEWGHPIIDKPGRVAAGL